MRRWAVGLIVVGTLVASATPAVAAPPPGGQVPVPTVTGPVAGTPITSSPVPLPGYTQQEYFVSGTATGYQEAGTWGADGRWGATPAEQAPYTTRILVRRPADPARFSGTVVVEWLNVSSSIDLDPDFLYSSAQVLRAGDAWVGVSAQAVGVNTLRAIEPARYGSLSHPGDTFSYSIFSQATRALLGGANVDPLGGLHPRTLIADGESQSASRMVTYINAIQPIDRLFNGFLVHSRGVSAAPISQSPQVNQPTPPIVNTRTDLRTPVLTVETETDLLAPILDYLPATQADSRDFRLWEIAGTSHVDLREGNLFIAEVEPFVGTPVYQCGLPPNQDEESAVLDAALAQLTQWVRFGIPAPHANRITTQDGAIVRDADGNALGGIRTPAQQVPTAAHNGNANTGPSFPCALYGTSTPFPPQRLAELYPTHQAYVGDVARATTFDTLAGFVLPYDARQIVATAASAPVPSAS